MENKKITYEDIEKANKVIKTTEIKGKNYAEVNQRIKAFRMLYPQGTILTDMISCDNGVCIFKATVLNEDRILSTGTAYEKENSTFINKTSYIENCETSAVGRALGMLGLGVDTSLASADEVKNAMENQNSTKKSTAKKETKVDNKKTEIMIQDEQIDIIKSIYTSAEILPLLKHIGKSKITELTLLEASSLIKRKNIEEVKD